MLAALRSFFDDHWTFAECLPAEAASRCAAWKPAAAILDLTIGEEAPLASMIRLGEKLAASCAVIALLGPSPGHPEGLMPPGIHGAVAVDDPLEDWPVALAAAVHGAAYFSPSVAGHCRRAAMETTAALKRRFLGAKRRFSPCCGAVTRSAQSRTRRGEA